MKKVGKTTRPFRYDLNKIPYDYTLEVRNRFKGLDLIDRVPDELWTEVCDTVQETGIKTIPMEKKCKKKKNKNKNKKQTKKNPATHKQSSRLFKFIPWDIMYTWMLPVLLKSLCL